jgi:hypothetical protein
MYLQKKRIKYAFIRYLETITQALWSVNIYLFIYICPLITNFVLYSKLVGVHSWLSDGQLRRPMS